MSSRHLMNIGMGSVAVLLAISVGAVFTSLGDRQADQARVDLAASQQALVQQITKNVEELNAAGNLMEVGKARETLGENILHFDRSLNTLLKGGSIVNADGRTIEIDAPRSGTTRRILQETAQLWVQTGMPLADLAAGEFSIFSSAGRAAVAGLQDNDDTLIQKMDQAATAIGDAAHARQMRGQAARWISLGLTGAFLGLGLMRFKPGGKPASPGTPADRTPATSRPLSAAAPEQDSDNPAPTPSSPPQADRIWDRPTGQTYVSPVDFDNVNASVDQLSVDMNTIAASTGKMQLAIDSVGHAMQGMLFSLNQMAQDTAEGYKIVRGANNAATYTGSAAGELAESAQEMSRVVARVTQLAMKTRQVAGQIEAESVATGSTGEAFTSVVAGEVQGLARQTSQATSQIEQTVAEILGTARQYEEAIGQILKNIGAINKVSENLGELMLHPPAAGVAGTPLPGVQSVPLAPPPAPAAEAAPQPAPIAAQAAEPKPAPEPEPAPEPATAAKPPAPAPEPEPEPEPAADDSWGAPAGDEWGGTPAEPAASETTAEAIADTAAEPEDTPASNVFILGGGKKRERPKPASAPEAKPEPTPEPAPAPAEPAAAAPAEEEEEEDSGTNIFMLNKPKKKAPAEPKAEAPAPAPEPAPETEPAPAPAEPAGAAAPAEKEEEEGSGTNIFMLNKPKKKVPAEPKAETPEPEPEPKAEPQAKEEEEPVTVPADDGDKSGKGGSGGSDGNIFMLNKPKK